jgi:tetratricopeptide (TPR) repeat protein
MNVDGLAYALFGERNMDAADAMYQRLLGLWKGSVGETHPMTAMAWDKVGVFYSAQHKNAKALEAYGNANAIRAHFYATGESQQAAEAMIGGDMPAAVAYYQKGLGVLDPANPTYDELKGTMEGNVKSLDQVIKMGQAGPPKGPPKPATTKK